MTRLFAKEKNFVFLFLTWTTLGFAQQTPSKVASFFVPDLPADVQSRVTEINKLVAAERLYLAKETLLQQTNASDLQVALNKLTDSDFINYFQSPTHPITYASTTVELCLALAQLLLDKTQLNFFGLLQQPAMGSALSPILEVGLNFEAPLVTHFKQLGALVGQAASTSFSRPSLMWDQNGKAMLQNPALRQTTAAAKYFLSAHHALTPFWANHRRLVERVGLQQGSSFGFLSFVREQLFGQIWARFDDLDNNENPAFLVSHSANGTPEVNFIFTEIGGNDRQSDLSLAWVVTADGMLASTDAPTDGDLTPLLGQRIWLANTSEVDGDWYEKLNHLLESNNSHTPQDDLWILGQYKLFSDYINNEARRQALQSALSDQAINRTDLGLSSSDSDILDSIFAPVNDANSYVALLQSDGARVLDEIFNNAQFSSTLAKYLRSFVVEDTDLQAYHWTLFRLKNVDGKIIRLRVFKDVWGDEVGNLLNHAATNAKHVILLGSASVLKTTADANNIQLGDIVIPKGYRSLFMIQTQPPKVDKEDSLFSAPDLSGLGYKAVDWITSANSYFIENSTWLNFQQSNGVNAIDTESAGLTDISRTQLPTTAIYLVSNIIDSANGSAGIPPLSYSPLYEQNRLQVLAQVMKSVGAIQPQVAPDDPPSADGLITQALNSLPPSAGSIDRWKLTWALLAASESQSQNTAITADWLKNQAATLYAVQAKINDDDYFAFLASINSVVTKFSNELAQQRINMMFMISKDVASANANSRAPVQVRICSWNPQSPDQAQAWPIVNAAAARYNSDKIQFTVAQDTACDKFYENEQELALSPWSLAQTLRNQITQDIGLNFLSRDDGSTYAQFANKSFTRVFDGWTNATQKSLYLTLLTPTDEENGLLRQIGSLPKVRENLIAVKDRVNAIQTEGDTDIKANNPTWLAAVELRIERVPALPQRLLQFEYGKDDKPSLFVSLKVSDTDTSWDFALVEASELLTRFFVEGNAASNYRMSTGEYLEMLLNIDQGSSKSQYFFISEYKDMLSKLRDNLTKYIPAVDPRFQAAQSYIDKRLLRVSALQAKVFDGLSKEKIYRQQVAAARQKQILKLEATYDSLIAEKNEAVALNQAFTNEDDFVTYKKLNPRILALSNDRANLAKLFETYLPWEKFEPTELRYWKQVLTAMKNPLPINQRKIYFRGLSGSDTGHLILNPELEDLALIPTLENKMALMPVGWAFGKETPLANLNYLNYFYEFLGGGFHRGNNPVPDWAKEIRLLNTEGKWHSMEPKGSAFLSTSNFNVALNFSDQGNATSQTALATLLVDPRIIVPNFVSGFTSEYEHLTSLLDYPDELIKVYTSAELKALHAANGTIDRNLVIQSVTAAAKVAGVSRDVTEEEIFFEPSPADSAVEWWHNLIEATPPLSIQDFTTAMKSGIDTEFLGDLQKTTPYQPIRKE